MRRVPPSPSVRPDSASRTWDLRPESEAVREWTVDPAGGVVQGPLDLGFFDGGLLILHLVDDQVAVVDGPGGIRRVLLAGTHHLAVGEGGGALAPTDRLVFLHTAHPLELSWRAGTELWLEGAAGQRWPVPVIGACGVVVADPVRFHAAFLDNVTTVDADLLTQVVDALVRTRLETWLGEAGPDLATTTVELQARLASLRPEVLDEEIAEYGLACSHLAVYTQRPPVEEDPDEAATVETPGQNTVPCDNGP